MAATDVMWGLIQSQLNALRDEFILLRAKELANAAFALTTMTQAEANTWNAGLSAEGATAYAFISDGRKSGEGVGAGTGTPAYYNLATLSWKYFRDDTDVTV